MYFAIDRSLNIIVDSAISGILGKPNFKEYFITFNEDYHGKTHGALSFTNSENFASGPKSLREANTLFPNSFWIVITRFLGRITYINFWGGFGLRPR